MSELNIDDFRDRYATCPLCQRSNVGLRWYANNMVFDEHPMAVDVVAHPSPFNPGARVNPRAMGATYARVRCPASLAPLMPMEGA